MTTNTTINYAKLADDAADTYTSARDALNRAIANLAVVDSDRRGYQDIITADGHIDVPIFNVWFTQDEKQEIAEQAVAYYRAADAYVEARERLSDSISRATKNMQGRIKNGLGTLGN